MITRICETCQKPYETFPSQRPRYCTIQCAGAAKKKGEDVACAQCGTTFHRHPSRMRLYCSKSCARTAINLTEANPALHRDITGDKNPMYGKGLHGADNPMYGKRAELAPRWKGGRKVRKDGYALRYAGPDKYVLEHRQAIEESIGRPLRPGEVVHHIDHNPANNDISNLRLYASHAEHIRDAHS